MELTQEHQQMDETSHGRVIVSSNLIEAEKVVFLLEATEDEEEPPLVQVKAGRFDHMASALCGIVGEYLELDLQHDEVTGPVADALRCL